jgi:Dyp-type peroxidase family
VTGPGPAPGRRLQEGIHLGPGQRPPPAFRLLLLDVAPGTEPAAAAHALGAVHGMLAELKAGVVRDLAPMDGTGATEAGQQFGSLHALLGFGARLFDPARHDPPLTSAARPDYLVPLPAAPAAFPELSWTDRSAVGRGEADVLWQFTADSAAAVNCAAVEVCKLLADDGLPLTPVASFEGFGRLDGRGWLDFHDGVSNLTSGERVKAIEAPPDPAWMGGGTYLAFLRLAVDLTGWRGLPRREQELLVGRAKISGAPLGGTAAAPAGEGRADHVDPPPAIDPVLQASHVHRANRNRTSPSAPAGLRMFRQGYDYLAEIGPEGPHVGLNFVSFQRDLGVLQHVLNLPGWLGDVNFGGMTGPGHPAPPSLIGLEAGGLYAVPPRLRPFPGAAVFGDW